MKRIMEVLGWMGIGLALLASLWLDFANTAQGGGD